MPAPKGNKFWEKRSSHGRKPIFADPEQLLKAAEEYFQWNDENPLWEAKAFAYQGDVTIEYLPKMRALTIQGLCLFLDINIKTWHEYKAREDFTPVCEAIETAIYQQKFTGAASDLFNAAIIARDLGLKDKQEITGEDGGAIKVETSDTEIARRLAFLLTKGAKETENG